MSNYTDRIRRIVNRNKKFVIKLRIIETLKYGGNIYEIREIDENLLDQIDE